MYVLCIHTDLPWCVWAQRHHPGSWWSCYQRGSSMVRILSSHHATNSPSASLRCSHAKVSRTSANVLTHHLVCWKSTRTAVKWTTLDTLASCTVICTSTLIPRNTLVIDPVLSHTFIYCILEKGKHSHRCHFSGTQSGQMSGEGKAGPPGAGSRAGFPMGRGRGRFPGPPGPGGERFPGPVGPGGPPPHFPGKFVNRCLFHYGRDKALP